MHRRPSDPRAGPPPGLACLSIPTIEGHAALRRLRNGALISHGIDPRGTRRLLLAPTCVPGLALPRSPRQVRRRTTRHSIRCPMCPFDISAIQNDRACRSMSFPPSAGVRSLDLVLPAEQLQEHGRRHPQEPNRDTAWDENRWLLFGPRSKHDCVRRRFPELSAKAEHLECQMPSHLRLSLLTPDQNCGKNFGRRFSGVV